MQRRHFVLLLWALHASFAWAGEAPAALDRPGADPAVRPQDDLFRAVNGRWLADTPIPADKSSYGTFFELGDRADARVRKIVEELAAAQSPAGSNEFKVGAYFRAYMDTAAIDAAGLTPLQPWLKQVEAVTSRRALVRTLGQWQGMVNLPVTLEAGPDLKQPDVYVSGVSQSGLGMPNRSYYLDAGDRYEKARLAYVDYLKTLLALTGDAQAPAHATQVFEFEKRLATAQWTPVDNRDPQKVYNPMSLAALGQRAPGLNWRALWREAEVPPVQQVVVSQPSYATAVAKAVRDVPLPTWRLYLQVRLLDSHATVLPQAFREAHFAFHGRVIEGKEQPEPRWQQATASLNAALGEAVGQVYVARHFPPAYKARMRELVGTLLKAYDQSITQLSWMSPITKMRAKEKLARYTTKIGYPDTWRNYAGLTVAEGDALGNRLRAGRFDLMRQVKRVGQKVDKTEWEMTPQTVNAYYNPTANEIVFPAAILEPPFFDMAADDAANYGAIGAVIGHEISHGFDDQGSQFDGIGRLANWWTEADRKAFDALGEQLAAQYSAYEPLPGHPLNGKLTLGENIADLSGLQMAYKAYHLALNGQAAPVINGLTGDQRFFVAWAEAWRIKRREARALQLLTIDPHSPPEFRTNGAAVNHDGFHDSFGTRPGDGMYKKPEARIRIW